MRVGNLTQTVWRRSVEKQLHTEKESLLRGTSAEEMCAAWNLDTDRVILSASASSTGTGAFAAVCAVIRAVQDLESRGGTLKGVALQFFIPVTVGEEELKEVTAGINTFCSKWKIPILSARAEVNPALCRMLVQAAASGETRKNHILNPSGIKPGQQLILCGYVGLEGTLRIADEYEKELKNRFVPAFLRQIQELKEEPVKFSIIKELTEHSAKGGDFEVTAIQQIGSGGILSALWEIAEASGVGLQVDMEAMNIRQETVEVCEYFRMNPYYMTSGGCFIIAADEGLSVIRFLEERGARAGMLGIATAESARVITSGKEQRYIDRPASDELMRLLERGL